MERIRVAVVGRTKSGKSSLINALLGEELCCVGAAVDTTDKIHKLGAEQNGDPGIYLFDTPGIGADEEYEARTLAYLGVVSPARRRPVQFVPICRLRREADCPSKRVNGGRTYFPMAFQERSPKGTDKLVSCRKVRCPYFLPIHAGNPEMVEEQPDVLLFLTRAGDGGLSKLDFGLWQLLQEKYGHEVLIPVLTRVDELSDKGKCEVFPEMEKTLGKSLLRVSARLGTGMDALRSRLSTMLSSRATVAHERTDQAILSIFGDPERAARADEVREFSLSFHAVPYTLKLKRRKEKWEGELLGGSKTWKASVEVETEPGFFGIGLFRITVQGQHPGVTRPDEIEIRPVGHWEGPRGFQMVACAASRDWTDVEARLVGGEGTHGQSGRGH